LRGNEFEIDDFKTMVRIAEDFGVPLGLNENGWIRLGRLGFHEEPLVPSWTPSPWA
jgi:hypothetical protein